MSLGWNTSGRPRRAATGQTWAEQASYFGYGIDAAMTHQSSATDPSTGAPSAWGSSEVGTLWLDIGVDGTAANPVLKQWQQITATPTYGWRRMRLRKMKWLNDPATDGTVVFTTASPQVADVAWEDLPFATILDDASSGDVQDANNVAAKVTEVLLRVRITDSGTISSATKGYIAFRAKGGSQEYRIYAQVSGRPVEEEIWVPLDTNEKAQWSAVVGTGAPSFAYSATVVAFAETL